MPSGGVVWSQCCRRRTGVWKVRYVHATQLRHSILNHRLCRSCRLCLPGRWLKARLLWVSLLCGCAWLGPRAGLQDFAAKIFICLAEDLFPGIALCIRGLLWCSRSFFLVACRRDQPPSPKRLYQACVIGVLVMGEDNDSAAKRSLRARRASKTYRGVCLKPEVLCEFC